MHDRGPIRLDFANGHSAEVDILVGADGVRSQVRRLIAGEERAAYSGTSAFRGIVPVRDLPSLPDPHALQFWMGPGAQLLHYAIGAEAKDVNFFAVVEGPTAWTQENWVAPIAPDEAASAFAGWHPAVVEMVCAVPHAMRRACSPSGRCKAGGADVSLCWATRRTPCCRITGRAPTPRSRMP